MPKTKKIDEEILNFLRENPGEEFSLEKITGPGAEKTVKLLKKRMDRLVARRRVKQRHTEECSLYSYNKEYNKKKEQKANLTILLVSIVAMLLIGEIAIRVYYKIGDRIVGMDEEEVCTRDQYKLLRQEDNPNRFHPIHLRNYEYWNYSGVRPIANWPGDRVYELEDGRKLVLYDYRTNSQHMRNLEDFDREDDPNIVRIASLGDSFTWGADVPLKFSHVSMLESLIPNSESLNFGIEGTGIDNMYLRWKYDVLDYKPDVVLYTIYIQDIYRIRPCINKPRFRIVDNKLEITNLPPPAPEEIYRTYRPPRFESFLIKHLVYNTRYFGGVNSKMYDEGLKVLSLILDEIKARSEQDNTYLMVPIIRRGNDVESSEKELQVLEELKTMLDEKGIPYVDSDLIFEKEGYELTGNDEFNTFDHFRPEGYAAFAQGIKNKLEEDGVIEKQKDFYFQWDRERDILLMQNKENPADIQTVIPYDIIG